MKDYPEFIHLLEVPIDNVTMQQALDAIETAADENTKKKIYFVNTFYLNTAWEHPEYWEVLKQGDYVWGDGSGVRIASKIVRQPILDNVNGTDMIFPLCELCQRRGFRIFLLGSKPGVAEGLQAWMEERYPGIPVAGHHDGYFDWEKDREAVVGEINSSGAQILLVGFSAPRQELWIHQHAGQLACPVSDWRRRRPLRRIRRRHPPSALDTEKAGPGMGGPPFPGATPALETLSGGQSALPDTCRVVPLSEDTAEGRENLNDWGRW